MTQRKETELPLRSMRGKTIRTSAIVVLSFGLVSVLILVRYASLHFTGAYFIGALLGVLNGMLGFFTIEKFIDKDTIVFLKGVFLGMGVRLALLLGVFVLFIEIVRVNIAGLLTGLLIFYFTMTVLEVIFLNKRIELRKAMRESRP